MRRIVLSLALVLIISCSKAQVILNEFYSNPNSGRQEFFELYNAGANAEPLDCYTLVVYFRNANSLTDNRGFRVIDFPNKSVASKKYYTMSSATNINVQGTTATANDDWNTLNALNFAYIKQYDINSGASGYNPITTLPGANSNNIFQPIQSTGDLAVFLFKEGKYINGFLAGFGTGTQVPQEIRNMPSLSLSSESQNGSCAAGFTINWSQITQAEYNISGGNSGGSDNGFARNFDGGCGSWSKTSNNVNHTPGRPNGNATLEQLDGLKTRENYYQDPITKATYAEYIIDGVVSGSYANLGNTLPVTAEIYIDNTPFGALGENDVRVEQITEATFMTTKKTIPVFPREIPTITLLPTNIIIAYKTVLGCFDRVVSLTISATALPVTFSYFRAQRNSSNKQQVLLEWETKQEQNNKGFYLQRKTEGEWQDIGFVFSAADGGNSNVPLRYNFKDLNLFTGTSYYRMYQIDHDGKADYSEVKSVGSAGSSNAERVLIFPNPAQGGTTTILFPDAGLRNIILADQAGRQLRSLRNHTGNSLAIDKLLPGFYTLTVAEQESGKTSIKKLVVQ